ncbi:MAG: helix-turn-helix domain-containing protein [Spirochaetaceae bacterium]|jgi:excisionase family DNA binding protein|nr:helix-turn-helix domain-containing protein [Spirochaetaceae bacterium]
MTINSQPLTAEALSQVLGISEFTIRKLAREGQLPCIYVKRQPRFELEALVAYFKRLEAAAA